VCGLVTAHFTTVPALSLERSITFDGRKVYFFVIGLTSIPALLESLDLGDAVAQPIEIGTSGLQLVQDQSRV
jgi:hypothetical protein